MQDSVSRPNSPPSSPENDTLVQEASAGGVQPGAEGVVAAADDEEEMIELEFEDFDDAQLDDEEAAQRAQYETQTHAVEDEEGEGLDDEGDDDEDVRAEYDEDYDAPDDSDSENEEVRHRVKKSKADPDDEEEMSKRKDTRKGPATTKDRMLALRKENQRLRKTVPIDFGKRADEDGAKVEVFSLIESLKARQPAKAEPEEPEEPEEAQGSAEDAALVDTMMEMCQMLGSEPPEEIIAEPGEDEAEAASADNKAEEDAAENAVKAVADEPSKETEASDGDKSEKQPDIAKGGVGTVRGAGAISAEDFMRGAIQTPAQQQGSRPAATPASASSSLTAEQRARMEHNKAVAMAKRQARMLAAQQPKPPSGEGMAAFFQGGTAAGQTSPAVPVPPTPSYILVSSPSVATPRQGLVSPFGHLAVGNGNNSESTSRAPDAALPSAETESQPETQNQRECVSQQQDPESQAFDEPDEPAGPLSGGQNTEPQKLTTIAQEESCTAPVTSTGSAAADEDGSGSTVDKSAELPQPAAGIGEKKEGGEEDQKDNGMQEEQEDFVVADEWLGPKAGYVFTVGAEGLGYYLDRTCDNPAAVMEYQMSMLVDNVIAWLGDDPAPKKLATLEPFGWQDSSFAKPLSRQQFRELGQALVQTQALVDVESGAYESAEEESEEATDMDGVDDSAGGDTEEHTVENSDQPSQPIATTEMVDELEEEADLVLEDEDTGKKWSPWKPKKNSRAALKQAHIDRLHVARIERNILQAKLGYDVDPFAVEPQEMGPELMQGEEQDANYDPNFVAGEKFNVPDKDKEDIPLDELLNVESVEESADAESNGEEKPQDGDGETGENDGDGAAEEELTEEEKQARAEAEEAAKAERAARLKREAEAARRKMIARRKQQILELRKMALDDRKARKNARRNARNGLIEGEADESGSDFSDDDDEESAERQAIEELRGIDYLAAMDSDDENSETHRQLMAQQLDQDHQDFLKERGDVFDEDGRIVRHGNRMKALMRDVRRQEAARLEEQRFMQTSSDSESSSEDDDSSGDEAGSKQPASETDARAEGGRAFAFASQQGDAAADTTSVGAAAGRGEPVLSLKERKKARKRAIKRMRKAELAANRADLALENASELTSQIQDEVTNMLAPCSSRSRAAAVAGKSPQAIVRSARGGLRRRNTYCDASQDADASSKLGEIGVLK
jgi:hypothetical protein